MILKLPSGPNRLYRKSKNVFGLHQMGVCAAPVGNSLVNQEGVTAPHEAHLYERSHEGHRRDGQDHRPLEGAFELCAAVLGSASSWLREGDR
jgi:hypothetical protein